MNRGNMLKGNPGLTGSGSVWKLLSKIILGKQKRNYLWICILNFCAIWKICAILNFQESAHFDSPKFLGYVFTESPLSKHATLCVGEACRSVARALVWGDRICHKSTPRRPLAQTSIHCLPAHRAIWGPWFVALFILGFVSLFITVFVAQFIFCFVIRISFFVFVSQFIFVFVSQFISPSFFHSFRRLMLERIILFLAPFSISHRIAEFVFPSPRVFF